MALIEISKLKKEFKDILLFDDVTFAINAGERVGLIGNNGAGKTTLIKIILGLIDKDSGSIAISGGTTIGYLSQGILGDLSRTLYQEMLDAFGDIVRLQEKLKNLTEALAINCDDQALLNEYGRIEQRLYDKQGYNVDYQIDNMLFRFGFKKEDYDRTLTTFSGGEQAKIAFARLLLDRPSLLILDEPTNHLDMSTIEWLENYLRDYQGAILLISHDRFFLDCICNKIIEIDQCKVTTYFGNYTHYLQQKTLYYEQQLQAFNLQQKEIKKLKELIARFKPHPTKVNFAKDREKKLAKIKVIGRPNNKHKKVHFNLGKEKINVVKQFSFVEITIGYDQPLVTSFSDTIYAGQKIAIIGDNGVGKTTLIKSLVKKIPLLAGRIHHHRELTFGYYDQNQINTSSSSSVFDDFHDTFPLMDNFQIRSKLAQFLFFEEDMDKIVNSLSGGEKAKLSFAKLLTKSYDVLVLDEPTNHLDMETKKVLEDALIEYQGTILIVSHDRYFIDAVAQDLYVIENNQLNRFEGNYSLYRLNKESEVSEERVIDTKKKQVASSSHNSKKIEKEIESKEGELANLLKQYHDESNCLNFILLAELNEQINDLESKINELEILYLESLED